MAKKVLHLHSSFDVGGKEMRSVRLMEAFGRKLEHTVVSAEPGALSAGHGMKKSVQVRYPVHFPSLKGKPTPGRLQKLAKAMAGFDLILTYNFGAMDAVMAHTLFADLHSLPPLVHHEDGFDTDETKKRKWTRNWYRRIALGRASGLVVPSTGLEQIAKTEWQQPAWRVQRIVNGIDTARYGRKAKADALPGLVKREGERWIGTLAGLRKVKNLPRLVEAMKDLPEFWQLVIVGEGSERDEIRAAADRFGVSDRVHMPGFVEDPATVLGLFDIYALSSDSEQFPLSVVEAMASGLPVASPDVGDVKAMLAKSNRDYVSVPGDTKHLGEMLAALAEDEAARAAIGEANRQRARDRYDEQAMIDDYRAMYARALKVPRFP
ncbi:glycosyltransferase [Blastomonas marina]|uniref:Glycosyl transferase family 1 n=1 Tax=Blastomonas marina TaxID=1867408 RepID=A0ABQ1F5B6_9SPHN|nr:glycosyltransferase [Blastomonas marina]WPZ04250.1 glycosyltransferase [Blastomonas marina]GGA00427.1 glycosyl transferase family 1 [Blastomonas marina]